MPDIALVDSSDFQFLHQMKPFADLTDEIPELQEYSEKALAPCSADGRIYGQPFGVNCTAMFYNKKILEKAGCKSRTIGKNSKKLRRRSVIKR